MFYPFFEELRRLSPDFEAGRKEGFEIAESYFQKATRNFYRDVKKGMIKNMATLTTITSHECNCEFCWTNEPEKV